MSGGSTNVGEIRARITLDMAEFRRNLDDARRRIQDLEDQSRRGANGVRELGSALAALGAGAALSKLVSEMQNAVNEATKLHAAFAGLNAVAKGFGVQTKEAQAAVQDLASRGFMSLTQAAQAYKTALSTGLSLDESTKLINALADSAAYNRQSFYDMAGAVQASLDGIKNGNSVLSDAVGVTKNLSVMQKEYAATIGKTAGTLSDAEKIQAAYNGFLNETAIFAGNADQSMQGVAGSQARFTQATNEATVALGDAFSPALKEVLDTITPLIIEFANFTSANQELIAGLATGAVGVLTFITTLSSLATLVKGLPLLFNALKLAAGALGLSLGPIGWIAVAVGVAAGAFGAFTAAKAKDKAATDEMVSAQKELNDILDKSPVSRTAADIETLKSKSEELNGVLTERASLQERLDDLDAVFDRGEGTPQLVSETMDINDQLEEMDKKLRSLGYENVDQATQSFRDMNAAIEASKNAITDQDEADAKALATRKQTLKEMSAMATEFKNLNSLQVLDASQKRRLVEITNALIKQYPQLNAYQGEDGRVRADNIDMIINQINADKTFTNSAANNMETRLRNSAKEVQAEAQHIQTRIDNYNKLIQAMSAAAGAQASTFAESVAQGEKRMAGGTPSVGEIVFGGYVQNQAAQQKAAAEQEKAALDQRVKYLNDLATQVEKGTATFTADIVAQDPKRGSTSKPKSSGSGKTPEELAAEARKKAYEADLKTLQFQADYYDLSSEKQIEKYRALQKKHAQYMKENVDDARTITLQIKRLQEDTVQSRFDASSTWIGDEAKRMEDSGKTEKQIAETKLASWTRLRNKYAKDSEYYKKADEEVRQARKDVASASEKEAQAQYEASADWIDAEERRMTQAGKSEEEITKMKVDAWTRVRNRYSKDSEYYKRADKELYEARRDYTGKMADLADDLVKTEKSAIEAAKKADLDAIEERKKAALDDYDARIDAIQKVRDANKALNADADYETQLAEKRARLALLQSAVGPEGIAEREALQKEIERMQLEHDRELADRSLETQQDALKDEKSAQEKAFDDEKTATEAQYDTLLAAFDSYSGDIKTIEAGIAAFRVSSAAGANSQILTDLDTFLAQYNAKMSAVNAAQAEAQEALDLREYNANKDAWDAAKKAGNTAEMARLTSRNAEIRAKYGIEKDTGKLQHFADGGIVQGAQGQAVPIVAHGGEIVLNPQQQATLFDILSGSIPKLASTQSAAPTYITQHIDLGVDEVTLTDKADISTFYDERARVLSRLQAMGVKE